MLQTGIKKVFSGARNRAFQLFQWCHIVTTSPIQHQCQCLSHKPPKLTFLQYYCVSESCLCHLLSCLFCGDSNKTSGISNNMPPPKKLSEEMKDFKGSCTYYVITFGCPKRPPPLVDRPTQLFYIWIFIYLLICVNNIYLLNIQI